MSRVQPCTLVMAMRGVWGVTPWEHKGFLQFWFLETPLQHAAMVTSRRKPSASTKNQTLLLW